MALSSKDLKEYSDPHPDRPTAGSWQLSQASETPSGFSMHLYGSCRDGDKEWDISLAVSLNYQTQMCAAIMTTTNEDRKVIAQESFIPCDPECQIKILEAVEKIHERYKDGLETS